MAKILLINGPNLNMLGQRETAHYGKITLAALEKALVKHAKGHNLTCLQSNAEHEIIAAIQESKAFDFIIINPGAFTHTSIAIRDALLAVAKPFIEVHLSNIYSRESFRHYSYLSDIAVGSVNGLGTQGYFAALNYALEHLS